MPWRRERLWINSDVFELVASSNASEDDRRRALSPGTAAWQIERALHDRFSLGNDHAMDQLEDRLFPGHGPPSLWRTEHARGQELLREILEGRLLVVPEPPLLPIAPRAPKGESALLEPQPSMAAKDPLRVTAWWATETGYCGDTAIVRASVVPPESGRTPATVTILDPTTGGELETIDATAQDGILEVPWHSRAVSANWRNEQFIARVSIAGQTVRTSNTFRLRSRPTTDWETLRNPIGISTPYVSQVFEHVDARLESDRVHYSLKVRLSVSTPTIDRGGPDIPLRSVFSEPRQQFAKRMIEDAWSRGFQRFAFHRVRCQRHPRCDCRFDCCKATFSLDFNFVPSGEHFRVGIITATPTSLTMGGTTLLGASYWSEPPLYGRNEETLREYLYPHEIGHMLGQYDEYEGSSAANDPGHPPDQPIVGARNTVMAGYQGPYTIRTTEKTEMRHYRWVLRFLNSHTPEDPYETIPA